MPQTDPGAGSAAREVPLTSPPREHGGATELVIAVLLITATLGIVLFVALVIVPSAGAAGGCGAWPGTGLGAVRRLVGARGLDRVAVHAR
jgi:hypothetical protein